MTEDELLAIEEIFDSRFGADGWSVDAYVSPAERPENKPILPTTSEATGRMGHPRNWIGPDVPLIEAKFRDYQQRWHSLVFTTTEDAIGWLGRNHPANSNVVL